MEPFRFITTFFLSKKVSMLTLLVCWQPGRTRVLWRLASEAGLRVKVFSPVDGPCEMPPYDVYREGALLDLTCPGAADILHKASSSRAFIHRYSWLLLHESSNSTSIAAALVDVDILPDADVTWSAPNAAADVYRVKAGHPVIVTPHDMKRSDILQDMELMWGRLPSAVTRRKYLNNTHFKSVTVVTQPQHFKGWSDLTNRQIDTYPKLTYPLMMLLAEDLHLRYNLRQVDLYGEERNGSFDGVSGQLQRREAEVGLASMFMRSDRWRVLHFAAETVELKGPFIFRQPPHSAVNNIFLLPLSGGVWAAIGGVLLLAALLLAAASRVLRVSHPDLEQLSISECFTFALGTICQQGFHTSPGAVPVRIAMVSALMSSLFLFTAYSAKIVVLLETPSNAIKSVEDLARSPLALGIQETTYKRVYFAESVEPATQYLYRRKLLPLGERAYLSVIDGIARMRTGLFAFQVEQSAGYEIISKTFTEHEKCGLQEVHAFRLPMVAVPLARHSGLRELVAARLRWQREVGLMSRWRRQWLEERPRCDAGAGGAVSVGLADVLPALQVLAAGAGLAVGLLAAELTLHTFKRNCR